ncbi:uncharacterized protein LOC132245549 [Alligator mississippiensis]|uniref:uncharacterized protein LOC132245549 n=1 Tax=Alligator mississippiensis TaxID=8496 RepID=UPI002877E2E2|nr:uncharacterized protein LOC132245549 [Alligator mississippiensis]
MDDLNVLCQNKCSGGRSLWHTQVYEAAAGAKLNVSKSTCLATGELGGLESPGGSVPCEGVKVLGLEVDAELSGRRAREKEAEGNSPRGGAGPAQAGGGGGRRVRAAGGAGAAWSRRDEAAAGGPRWRRWSLGQPPAFRGAPGREVHGAAPPEPQDPSETPPPAPGHDLPAPHAWRQRFRGLRYREGAGPREVCGRLRELAQRWLEPQRRSKEQMLELVVLEQFLAILPRETRSWEWGRGAA